MRTKTLGFWSLFALWSLAMVTPTPVWAGDAPAKVPPTVSAPPLASGSELAGLGFGNQPYLLHDNGAFFDTMNQIAAESHRSCGTLESFGWELDGDVQSQVDKLTGTLLGSLRQAKFLVRDVKSKVVPTSDAVLPYTAERSDRQLLVLLTLSLPRNRTEKAELVLLICDTSGAK